MEIDEEKINQAAMALLYLTADKDGRAWKQMDWEVLDRLHEQELIYNPVGKAKSIHFTPEGLQQAEALFEKLFAK